LLLPRATFAQEYLHEKEYTQRVEYLQVVKYRNPMPRPAPKPSSALATAIQAKRADLRQQDAADVLGVSGGTLSRLERGTHQPSTDTALKLARWLGWSMEQVIEAANAPAPTPSDSR
jgi:DNA-binding XRE family transcriptional regulator